jgi:rare lipoprotein A (peptidoglycan hydrolase)
LSFKFGWILPVIMAGLLICAARHARAGQSETAAETANGIAADFPAEAQFGASGDWIGETGVASFYAQAHQGKRTASGSRFNQMSMTAAHPWLPLGTKVRVTVERTGRAVVVTINDRLPSGRRVIDVSLAAARALGFVGQGLAEVSLAHAGISGMALSAR